MRQKNMGFLPRYRTTVGQGRGRQDGDAWRRAGEGREEEVVQLKVQMLLGRLARRRPSRELEKSSLTLSKSKTSKLTFAKGETTSLGDRLRELKQRTQNQFQFQFEILMEDYHALTQAHLDFIAQKQTKTQQKRSEMAAISGTVERMKEMALSLSLSRRYLKIYSQMVRRQEGKKRVGVGLMQTPFRLSLTPFHKDNSLLISVKRSLEGFATAKKPEQSHNDDSYKYSENQMNPNDREKESSYKDFIKEAGEGEGEGEGEDDDASFDVLEHSILEKLHVGGEECQKRIQRSRTRMEGLAALTDQLGREMAEERRSCVNEWKMLEGTLRDELAAIADAVSEGRRSAKTLQKDTQEILALMEESIDDVLLAQRKAYRLDHTAIIENLHQVISIFQ